MIPFLRKAAALGYRAVEIGGKRPHLSPLDYRDRAKLDAVRDEAARLNLEIATIAGYTDFTAGRATADIPLVEMQIGYVDDLSRMAACLGAKVVRVFSGYSPTTENYQSRLARMRRRVCGRPPIARAEHGVTLGLQNHHDIGIAVEAYEELLDEVNHPQLKAMFDPWSVALTGGDLRTSAERLAPRMVQTTLADYVRQERFAYDPAIVNYRRLDPPALRAVPLGRGFSRFAGLLRGLRAGGFTGYVAYEMCSPLRGGGSEANLDTAAVKSLEHIKRLIG